MSKKSNLQIKIEQRIKELEADKAEIKAGLSIIVIEIETLKKLIDHE